MRLLISYIDFLVDKLLFWLETLLGKKPVFEARRGINVVRVYEGNGSRYMTFGGRLVQSYEDTAHDPPLSAWNAFTLAPFFFTPKKTNIDALSLCILGYGGGVIGLAYKKDYPKSIITGVELNDLVIQAAESQFGIPENTTIIQADAGQFIGSASTTYDIIAIDLFDKNNTLALVAEASFLKNTLGHTNKTGVVVINYIGNNQRLAKLVQNLSPHAASVFAIEINKSGAKNTFIFATHHKITKDQVRQQLLADHDDQNPRMRKQLAEAIEQMQ